MEKIRWIARQLLSGRTGGWKVVACCAVLLWKVVACCAVLLLSLHAAGPSAQSLPPTLAPDQILMRMERRLEQQLRELESYRARRRYSAAHPLLGDSVYLLVQEQYKAPEEKKFKVLERGGMEQIQKRLFSRLLEVELETASEAARRAVDISRRNYRLTYSHYDVAKHAYVFEAEPRTANPYLFRGKVWIHAEDFAVQRIEGEPVKRHSAMVRQSRFVHEFAKFGEFWFPVHHTSTAKIYMFGQATLEIQYFDYEWKAR
ncbi:MAG: hypothetical protein A3H27_08360 [Acidobacteria bacterium RIFCSPLOWO2_02_FULL_59_13]|nr:MAG: hypothetical protein A3H27_08360 [Acidobacteria bacterium RIFCSPLOWO2_02_FULL_59_13]